MKTNLKVWILERINEDKQVQVAVTYSNACYWAYLTTSGRVCRKELGYVEDTIGDNKEILNIRKITFSSIHRLQKTLSNLSN